MRDDCWLWRLGQTDFGQCSFTLQFERHSRILDVTELVRRDPKGNLDQWIRFFHALSKIFGGFRTGSARSTRIERIDVQRRCHERFGER